jgi:acetylornithine deacetylase/succinyl-diaminopimelate desuccinylase-like protein
MADALNPVLGRIDATFDESLERVKALLRIKSISTDPDYAGETRRAAEWCAEQLGGIGFDASVRDTQGHPIVVAHSKHHGDGPRLLYYGHYDVQPPDPFDLWESDPFEPTIVDSEHGGKIVARGAVDDKGQLMTFIEAFRAWKDVHGSLPADISVMLEGEEETGSPSLDPFLEAHRDELTADVCIVSDTGMWDVETPAVTYMLRGLVYLEATLKGPAMDLHSGMYGGAVVNPNNALAKILGELIDDDGVIQIPGMYDDVRELTEAEAKQWAGLGFDEAGFLRSAGLETPRGEKGRSTLERIWARPTCDINGMWGGYTGRGAKTVIPAQASAKISCRLVPDQNAEKIHDGLVRFLTDRTPPDCEWEFTTHGKSPAIRVPTDSPFLEAALNGLGRVFENEPVIIGCGGSIPVVGSVQNILGFDSLLVGFGLDDDRVHSPNEKFELRCLRHGIESHASMLEAFAGLKS